MPAVPDVVLNNGKKMPILGLGTWKAEPNVVKQAVKDAIDVGYRHFDCAHFYLNEAEIGEAIQESIDAGKVKREDLFITSKLWNTYHRPGAVEPALRVTLKNLGLDYLDLYLVHWPVALKEGDDLWPVENGKVVNATDDYLETWKAMEEVHKNGLTKSIGISNFNKEQIERLLQISTVVPVVNQVESHPYLAQTKLMAFCEKKKIAITAYCPLGSRDCPWLRPDEPRLLEDPRIQKIAEKYGKTTAQILLKYQVQRGNITIPKSVNKERMKQNLEIFDFEMSDDDINVLNSFDRNSRICLVADWKDNLYYPFHAEY